VPGHSDKERPIVTKVRRPPVLGIGHQVPKILLYRLQIQILELFCIVKVLVQRAAKGRVLMEEF